LVLSLAFCCFSLDNGLGKIPQMGWNSWNRFACGINETLIRNTADALVKTGLKDAGYIYLNMDDCWAGYRDTSGIIHPDPTAFPSGIAALASYAHSQGLLFGLYSDAGTNTCAGRPGSLGYETNDANTYASWGVDYLKYDNCYSNNIPPEKRYPIMRDALNATERKIYFSMCEWGVDNPATWARSVGNSWRTTGDIRDEFSSMVSNLDQNDEWAKYAAPGGWNDPDMLEVGNGGMNTTAYISHFSLWALVKAPLLIGCDLSSITDETLEILTNAEVIAVNQDPLGVQGSKVYSDGIFNVIEVWAGPLFGGNYAAVLFNRGSYTTDITANWADIGIDTSSSCLVRDLWLHEDIGSFTGSYTASVESAGVVMITLTGCS